MEPLVKVRILLPEPTQPTPADHIIMILDKACQLFFGCKIDSKLREGLAQAKPGDRRYFEDPDSEFLRIVTVAEEKWIGKVVKGGIPSNGVEDVQRNVSSILRRIAPNVRISPASIKIFALAPDLPEVVEPPPREPGPYIR